MLAAYLLAFAPFVSALPTDSDGDGLSDFDEVHKYLTNPKVADSDGDGIPDGDWHERREYTYTVRTVIEVLRPVTPDSISDDFQDARVLYENEERVQLEVLHYPFSTATMALESGPSPATSGATPIDRSRWLAPGLTSDHDAELGAAIREALAADSIDTADLEDPATVARVAAWLCQHADYHDGFTTFVTGFDGKGAPFIPEELVTRLEGDPAATWPREISARGMFERGSRGSCTSSAIYLSGCLRALGVPTRTMLIVPLFDAGDEREWAMARGRIQEPTVRRTLLGGMDGLRNAWASHTMNEVYLRGRWWRLDYGDLGVGNLRRERYGLTTRVATLHDWADARAWETIGRRQTLHERDAVLDGNNPYSMLVVDELHGVHSTLTLPEPTVLTAKIDHLRWTDDPELPSDVLGGLAPRGRFGLVAEVSGLENSTALKDILTEAARRIRLQAAGHPDLGVELTPGCWWWRREEQKALVYVPFSAADRRDLVQGVQYHPVMEPKTRERSTFVLAQGITVLREVALPIAQVEVGPNRLKGVVLDETGSPVRARVTLVMPSGSISSGTDETGRFDFQRPKGDTLTLHASTKDGRVAVASELDGEITLRLAAGATVNLSLSAKENCRCALFAGDTRIEDFTLRPNKTASSIVPPGELRVRLYRGDQIYEEREISLAAGAQESLAFSLDGVR